MAIAAVVKLKLSDDVEVAKALSTLTDDEFEGDSDVRQQAREALRTLSQEN